MAHGTNIPLHRTKAPKENEDCRLCSATLSTPGVRLMLFRGRSVSSPLCLANQPPRSVGTQPARFAPPFPGTHAKHRRDQERIVNFQIGRTQLARALDIGVGQIHSIAADLTGNAQQRLQLLWNRRLAKVLSHLRQNLFISTQMVRSDRAMNRLAIGAVVLCRNVDCNQLAFGWSQGI